MRSARDEADILQLIVIEIVQPVDLHTIAEHAQYGCQRCEAMREADAGKTSARSWLQSSSSIRSVVRIGVILSLGAQQPTPPARSSGKASG